MATRRMSIFRLVAADDKETDQDDVNIDNESISNNQDNRLAIETPGTLLTSVLWCVRYALDVDTSGMTQLLL